MKKLLITIFIVCAILPKPLLSLADNLASPDDNGWKFIYDSTTNAIKQSPKNTSGNIIAGDFTYSSPEKLSIGLLQKIAGGMALTLMDARSINMYNAEEGLLAFKSDKFNNVYLIVDFRRSKTMGLFWKEGTVDKYSFNWLYVNKYNNAYELKMVDPDNHKHVIGGGNDELKKFVGLMNGEYHGELSPYNGINYGWLQEVSNLKPNEKINNIKICGKAVIDFSKSQYWEYLSDNDKTKAPKNENKWPGDFLVAGIKRTNGRSAVPVYLQYVFSDGVFVTATSNNFKKGYATIDNNRGTWEIDMTDLPIGKYKIMAEFFLAKNDNTARPDTPISGSIADYLASLNNIDENMEIFMNEPLEFEVIKDSSGTLKVSDSSLKDCSKTLELAPKSFWDAGRMNLKTNSDCDKITEGNSIMLLIKKAICATLEVLKDWADGFFLWAKDWMEKSMGTYKGESVQTPTNVPGTGDVPMSDGSSGSGSTQSGGSGGSSGIVNAVNLASNSIKIDNSAKQDIIKELGSNSQISAKVFAADESYKPNFTKGTEASISITDPSETPKIAINTQVPISSYSNVSKFVVLFPANGNNYQVQVFKTGENYKITDAGVQKYSGSIPESTTGDNESSEQDTTYNFRLLGYVTPDSDADKEKYAAKYQSLQIAYQKDSSAVKIRYGTSSNNLAHEGKIEIYEWSDSKNKIKMKILGANQFPTPATTVVVKISWGDNSILFSTPSSNIGTSDYKNIYYAR